MKQVAWHFVRMEEEIRNKEKKISASTCISHFLSFEVVSAPMSCLLDNICPFLSIGLMNERYTSIFFDSITASIDHWQPLLRMSSDALL